MKRVVLATLLALLAACADKPLPTVMPSPGPDDQAAPTADRPYRPVMAGTVSHGIGDRP
jgi:type IV pilus biogenesis protein CpaD/CtpE